MTLIHEQLEFEKWLKQHDIYSQFDSVLIMRKMFAVRQESIKDIQNIIDTLRERIKKAEQMNAYDVYDYYAIYAKIKAYESILTLLESKGLVE